MTRLPRHATSPASPRKPGRPAADERTKALHVCQAKPWAHCVWAAVAADPSVDREIRSWADVDRVIGRRLKARNFADQVRFSKYARGSGNPGPETLKLVDELYPGTADVYELGPGRSFLWPALGNRPSEALAEIEREWRNGAVVRCAPHGNLRVVPQSIAARCKLSVNTPFPVAADVLDLLQPWQEEDDYLGILTDINGEWRERRLLHLDSKPRRGRFESSLIPAAVDPFGNAALYDAVALPPIASHSYDIACARSSGGRATISVALLRRHGISAKDLRECFGDTLNVSHATEYAVGAQSVGDGRSTRK